LKAETKVMLQIALDPGLENIRFKGGGPSGVPPELN
jgi:hypothetical protein